MGATKVTNKPKKRIAPASAAAAAVAPVPPPDAGAPRRSRPKGGASRNVAGSTAPPVPPSAPDPAQSNGARVPPKEKEELPFADAARDSDGIEVIAPDAGAVARARSMTAKARESEANNAAYTRHEDSYVEDDALPSQQEAPDAPSSDYHDDHSLPRAAGHRASGIAHATATSHPQRSGAVKSEAIGAVKSEAIDNDARRSSLVPKDYQTFLETLANPKYCPFSIPYGQKTTGLQSSLIALQRAGLSIFNTQYMMTKLGELLAKFAAELDVDAGKPTGNKHTYVLLGSGSEQAARILKDLQDNSRATARRAAPPPNQQRLKAQDLVLANNSSYQPVQPHDSDADADVESRDHDRSQHTSSKRRTTEKRKKESAAPSSSAGPLRKASADADVESEDASSGAVKAKGNKDGRKGKDKKRRNNGSTLSSIVSERARGQEAEAEAKIEVAKMEIAIRREELSSQQQMRREELSSQQQDRQVRAKVDQVLAGAAMLKAAKELHMTKDEVSDFMSMLFK